MILETIKRLWFGLFGWLFERHPQPRPTSEANIREIVYASLRWRKPRRFIGNEQQYAQWSEQSVDNIMCRFLECNGLALSREGVIDLLTSLVEEEESRIFNETESQFLTPAA